VTIINAFEQELVLALLVTFGLDLAQGLGHVVLVLLLCGLLEGPWRLQSVWGSVSGSPVLVGHVGARLGRVHAAVVLGVRVIRGRLACEDGVVARGGWLDVLLKPVHNVAVVVERVLVILPLAVENTSVCSRNVGGVVYL
jgi:hypothetical protein